MSYRLPSVRVLVPPDPIVEPGDLTGVDVSDDAVIAAKIAAVTEAIDGPGGWLGRSLGEQTLEALLECWPVFRATLPYGPVIEVEAVEYTDKTGEVQTLLPSLYGVQHDYFWMKAGTWPDVADEPYPIRVRYRAGYDGVPVEQGGTGPVPERARLAVILSTQNLVATGAENLFLRVDEAEGVGRQEYIVSDAAGKVVATACDNLLQTLRIYG